MSSLAEMRAELKALRKESADHKPVSRMKKSDIASQLERLRVAREETPASAAVPSAPPRRSHPAAVSIKEAKREEFPVEPESGTKKGMPRKTARKAFEGETPKKAAAAEKGASKKDLAALLKKMLEED